MDYFQKLLSVVARRHLFYFVLNFLDFWYKLSMHDSLLCPFCVLHVERLIDVPGTAAVTGDAPAPGARREIIDWVRVGAMLDHSSPFIPPPVIRR
jgi:hypothetical protein